MRLLNILLKPAELWSLGLERIRQCLGRNSKSRRLAEQQATINQLRFQLHEAEKKVLEVCSQRDSLESRFTKEELESKLKLATESINDIKGKLDVALDEHYKKPILTLSEKDSLINLLRQEIAFERAKYEAITTELENSQKECRKHKDATSSMWKFIYTRHRLNIEPEKGSIREVLQRLERQ